MKKKFTLLYGLLASSLCLPVGHGAPKGDDPYSYTLPEIVVYGKRTDAYYYGGQVARQNSLGNIGDTDFMDVPFNVLSLSQKAIDINRSSGNTMLEVLTLDPTVTSDGNNTYNDVRIRGYVLRRLVDRKSVV